MFNHPKQCLNHSGPLDKHRYPRKSVRTFGRKEVSSESESDKEHAAEKGYKKNQPVLSRPWRSWPDPGHNHPMPIRTAPYITEDFIHFAPASG